MSGDANAGIPTELEFPREPPAPDGSVVEVAPGILWARMPLPIALDHINVYLLHDGDGWVLVDTGLDTPTARGLWKRIIAERLEGLPLKAVLCTHWHYDHSGLAHWLTTEFNVPMHMTHGEYFVMRVLNAPPPAPLPPEHLEFFRRAGLDQRLLQHMMDALRGDPYISALPMAFRRVRDGDLLPVGGRQWQVIVGEGHSPEQACLYCAEDRILIAGDQLLPRISSNVHVSCVEPEADPLELWFDSLQRLGRLAGDTLVLPSHERIFRGLHARVGELRAHHARQLDVLRAFIRERGACSAFDASTALFPGRHKYADYWLVIGETIAHLSWLRYRGVIRRVLDDDGVYRFTLADG